MALTGGTTTNLSLKKAAESEPFDTDWAEDFNDNLDAIDTNLLAKSGGTLTGDVTIARTGSNPAQMSIKGDGNTYNYSVLSLQSDETTDKSWNMIHRKNADHLNGLILQYFDGSNYYDMAILETDGTLKLLAGIQMPEISDPSAPASNNGILYVRDNGSSKSQLCVRFPSGAVQVIATEP